MSARTGHPAHVAEALVAAQLRAFDAACKRYRAAVAEKRKNPHAASPVPPQTITDRAAAEIIDIEAHTEESA